MSAVASAPSGHRPTFALAPAEAAVCRWLFAWVWKFSRWAWAAAVLIATVLGVVIANLTPITTSVWANVGQWPRWWLFGAAVVAVTTYLPLLVAHGMTRRACVRAFAATGALISLLWAGFMVVGHVVEAFVYGRIDPDLRTGSFLFRDGYDVLPMFAEYALTFAAYGIAGALVGAAYYRFGPIRGTLLLPLTMLPAAAVGGSLAGWLSSGPDDSTASRPVVALLVLASLGILVLAALATHLMLRDVPIRGKK